MFGAGERHRRAKPVDKVRVYHDRTDNTLTVWFDDPAKEVVCEEVSDDVVLVKDRRRRVIGFERLNYHSRKQHARGHGHGVCALVHRALG
jgi:hypothetical protein